MKHICYDANNFFVKNNFVSSFYRWKRINKSLNQK
jgi:hypothetical protein